MNNFFKNLASFNLNLVSKLVGEVPTITPSEVLNHKNNLRLIDVRRAEEYTGELGHIEGAKLKTLGADLDAYLAELLSSVPTSSVQNSSVQTQNLPKPAIVFICRSGARSANATMQALALGFSEVYNMEGGMIRWNEENKPTVI